MAGILEKGKEWLRKVLRTTDRRISRLYDIGFHGDEYLLELVDGLMVEAEYFIETGTNVGSTLRYVARRWPKVECFSCEPDKEAFEAAKTATHNLRNVSIHNERSDRFLERLERERPDLFERKGLFWLDAHGYGFQWCLREEVSFVTENFPDAYLLIDDFKVPGAPWFGYDMYDGQVCSLEYVETSIHDLHEYQMWYPSYQEKTSPHHPLRGWALLVRHHNASAIPEPLDEHLVLAGESRTTESPPNLKPTMADHPSMEIRDRDVIRSFEADPDNSFLVSFPRTGSHWLRMLMELYFGRPSLRRIFYYPERDDFLIFHTHDLDLQVERSNVIYLYRDPVPTIYSQLSYHEEDLGDLDRIIYWADLYGRHMSKWLHEEQFTVNKTVLRYEGMRESLAEEFAKICRHFGEEIDRERFEEVASRVTREHVNENTIHDPQVIDLEERYQKNRERFRREAGDLVWTALLRDRPHLKRFFNLPSRS